MLALGKYSACQAGNKGRMVNIYKHNTNHSRWYFSLKNLKSQKGKLNARACKCSLQITSRYCRWWGNRISSAGTTAWLFAKDK